MAIQYTAVNYADFKLFMANEFKEGRIYYADIPETAQNLAFQFAVFAIDVGRRVTVSMFLSGQVEQKPTSFSTDFPTAIQMTGLSSAGFTTE